MEPTPSPVTVRYSVAGKQSARGAHEPPPPPDVDITFHPSTPVPSPANIPVLASFAPEFAGQVAAVAALLIPYQDAVLEWLRASPDNARRFVESPLDVMVQVFQIPDDLRQRVEAVQQEWPHQAGGGR